MNMPGHFGDRPTNPTGNAEQQHGGWVGVDLDGTLAYYDGSFRDGRIGDPIPAMADRVRVWIAEGRRVRIFTARVALGPGGTERRAAVEVARNKIRQWTLDHFGVALEVTAEKDPRMTALIDDRAVAVRTNDGEYIGPDEALKQAGL